MYLATLAAFMRFGVGNQGEMEILNAISHVCTDLKEYYGHGVTLASHIREREYVIASKVMYIIFF